jgi:hypothetical protein
MRFFPVSPVLVRAVATQAQGTSSPCPNRHLAPLQLRHPAKLQASEPAEFEKDLPAYLRKPGWSGDKTVRGTSTLIVGTAVVDTFARSMRLLRISVS